LIRKKKGFRLDLLSTPAQRDFGFGLKHSKAIILNIKI